MQGLLCVLEIAGRQGRCGGKGKEKRMPLKLILKREVVLNDPHDVWIDFDAWREYYEDNLNGLVELFEEDIDLLLRQVGGLVGIIEDVQWVDKEEHHD